MQKPSATKGWVSSWLQDGQCNHLESKHFEAREAVFTEENQVGVAGFAKVISTQLLVAAGAAPWCNQVRNHTATHSFPHGAAASDKPGATIPGAELRGNRLTAHFLRCARVSGKLCHVIYTFSFSYFFFAWPVSQYEVCRACRAEKILKKYVFLCKVIWTQKKVWT